MRFHRRRLLQAAIGAPAWLSFSALMPPLLRRTAALASSSETSQDTVLVMLQLTGGNDGLNTVVPYQDDAYGRNRQTLRLGAGDVHKIDHDLGLHPAMRSLWEMYQEGALTIVQGVGYPKSSRNHDQALRDWQTGHPADAGCQTGWGGRVADWAAQEQISAVPAAFVGEIAQPRSLAAANCVVPSIRRADQLLLGGPQSAASTRRDAAADQQADSEAPADQNPLLKEIRGQSRSAVAGSRRLQAVLDRQETSSAYPPMSLSRHLATVAELIRGDLGIRLFFVELGGGGFGGFDNHAGQKDNHAALLEQLSESVAAFVADLDRDQLTQRVLVATYSEFGRTLSENGRKGTGHGEAAPVLITGGTSRGGLIGPHPSLQDLEQDAPKYHTDFRRVYATLLDDWLGFDSQAILGGRFEPVPFLG
jgi:uncharacterized protein (DUF1501 family)